MIKPIRNLFVVAVLAASAVDAQTTPIPNLEVTGEARFDGPVTYADPVAAAGSLQYKAPNAGSGARSLPSKLGDLVSILDFPGCDKSGASDSTSCIQAALNSGAQSVYVPAGRYKHSGLVLPQTVGFTLFGEGPGSVLIQTGGSIHYPSIAGAFTFDSHSTIRDLAFDGTAGTDNTLDTSYSQTLDLLNLSFNNVPVGFSSLKLDGNPQSSTYMHDVRVKNIRIYSTTAGKAGIELGSWASDSTIDGFIMNGGFAVQYGLLADVGAQTTMLSNSHPYNATEHVVYLSGNNNDFGFTGNTIDNAQKDVFYIKNSARTRITATWIESINSHFSGLLLDNSWSNTIHGLACQTYGVSDAQSCVSEINGSSNNSVFNAEVDSQSNYAVPFAMTGSGSFYQAVNSGNTLALMSAAQGAAPTLTAVGADATIPVTLVPKGNGSVNFDLTTAGATLGVYSDTASEVILESYRTSTPSTKYNLNLAKYGGRVLVGGGDDGASKLQVAGTGSFTGSVASNGGSLIANDPIGTGKAQMVLENAGQAAWGVSNASAASNTFSVDRYVNGAFQDSPISISNTTGNVAFTGAGTFGDPITTANNLKFLSIGQDASDRSLRDKLADVINGADFGMQCDGSQDDTAALNHAMSYAAAVGPAVLNLPVTRSGCKISATIDIPGGVILRGGRGQSSGLVAGVVNLSPMINLSGAGSGIEDMYINASAAGQNTAGVTIQMQNVVGAKLSGLYIQGPFVGIAANGNQSSIDDTIINGVAGVGAVGIKVGDKTTFAATTDLRVTRTTVVGDQSAPGDAGMLILDSGGILVSNSDMLMTRIGTMIDPGLNQHVMWSTFHGTYLGDTNTQTGFAIDTADASATVYGTQCETCWASSAGSDNILVNNHGGGVVDGLHFTGLRSYASKNNGATINAGTNITIDSSHLCGNSGSNIFTTNALSGLAIRDSRIGSSCDGVTPPSGSPTVNGIAVTGSVQQAIITGNDFTGPSVPLTGAITGNSVVSNNIGLDTGPSVLATASQINVGYQTVTHLTGTTGVSTIQPVWDGRQAMFITKDGAVTFSGGNICQPFTSAAGAMVRAYFDGQCWYLN